MRVGNHMVFVLINCTDNMDNSCFKTLKNIFPFVLVIHASKSSLLFGPDLMGHYIFIKFHKIQ